MAFNSYSFLLFIVLIYFVFSVLRSETNKKILLLISSYVFYGWISPMMVLALFLYTVSNFFFGKVLAKDQPQARRRIMFFSILLLDIGFLVWVKYANFFAGTICNVFPSSAQWLNSSFYPNTFMHIGISFYSFSVMSYLSDIYRHVLKEPGFFLDFSLYVAFFPKLISGPIVRAVEFLPQCREALFTRAPLLSWGLFLCSWGFFKKKVIADNIALYVNSIFLDVSQASILESWIAVYGYAIQIYCDFGGYSDIAIGLSLLFGFHFVDNFNRPYGSLGFGDFWRRWHISFSTWLRDYLYIPLGGSHRGAIRTYGNLMITMLICGLWHGAHWTFIIWGGIHGFYLSAERFIYRKFGFTREKVNGLSVPYKVFLCIVVYSFVSIAWIFFRADSVGTAVTLISNLFHINNTHLLRVGQPERAVIIPFVGVVIVVWHFFNRQHANEVLAKNLPEWALGILSGLLFLSCSIFGATSREFIYFQF